MSVTIGIGSYMFDTFFIWLKNHYYDLIIMFLIILNIMLDYRLTKIERFITTYLMDNCLKKINDMIIDVNRDDEK